MGVRSAVAVRPEQGEAAVPLSVSSSYAAVMGKQPEGESRSNRSGKNAKRVGRSAVERESRANLLGLADTSLIVGLLELGCAVGWVPGVPSWVWLPPPQRYDVPLV